MIAGSDKVRFELKNDKIRALYGHSYIPSNLVGKIYKTASTPPSILYHGTTSFAVKIIMSEGIRSMNRQYVHLSTDKKTAIQVAKRKVDRKSTRLNSSHANISYAVFCLKKKKKKK